MEKKFLAFWQQHQDILDSNTAMKDQLIQINSGLTKSFFYGFIVTGLLGWGGVLYITPREINFLSCLIGFIFGGGIGIVGGLLVELSIFRHFNIKRHNKKYRLLMSQWTPILCNRENLKIMLEYLAQRFKDEPRNMAQLAALVKKIASQEYEDMVEFINLNENLVNSIKDINLSNQAKLDEEKFHQENVLQIKSSFKDLNLSVPNEKKKYMELL